MPMTIVTNPLGRMRTRSSEPAIGPQRVLVGALAAVLTAGAVFRHTMPDDALLPLSLIHISEPTRPY